MLAQQRCGLWNRNGKEIWAQCQAYDCVFYRDTYRDLDILTLQSACILMGPEQFIKISLKKFELLDWLTNESNIGKSIITNNNKPENSETRETNVKLLEEYLRFIITISYERTKAGLSDEEIIRYE